LWGGSAPQYAPQIDKIGKSLEKMYKEIIKMRTINMNYVRDYVHDTEKDDGFDWYFSVGNPEYGILLGHKNLEALKGRVCLAIEELDELSCKDTEPFELVFTEMSLEEFERKLYDDWE
jgi:hypothetical protein